MDNIDRDKLLSSLRQASKNEELVKAASKRDFDSIIKNLPPEQSAELKRVISDKAELSRLLSSPQAQAIMKALKKDGK